MTCANCNKSLSLTPSVAVGDEHYCEKCFTSLAVDTLLNSVTPKCSADNHKVDPVYHPPHYCAHASGVECIQITEHMNFCVGNAIKYLWRCELKGKCVEDLEKARFYIDREIERRKKLA